jgi:hypothetical protein
MMFCAFRRTVATAWIAPLVGALAMTVTVRGEDNAKEKACDAKAAFARLKELAGTWKNDVSGHGDEHRSSENKVVYRLTGAGSALVETDFPGTGHEMISVYHLDGDDLRLTHYCAAGNQPRLKLDRAHSSTDKLVFVFDGGSNLNPAKDMHIHGMTMVFEKDGKVDNAWEGYQNGKSSGFTHFKLSRAEK